MTRRIRFTPFLCARTFAAASLFASCLGAGPAPAGEVHFGPLSPIVSLAFVVDLEPGDVDGDGDADLFVSNAAGMAWVENVDGSAWVVRTISTSVFNTLSMKAVDLDADGDLDVVATYGAPAVYWHENTAGNGSAWVMHTIATTFNPAAALSVVDVDGDGDLDVLAGDTGGNVALLFHENVLGDASRWETHLVLAESVYIVALSATDVDGDGDLDAVSSALAAPLESALAWHENLVGDGSAWALRTIASTASVVAPTVPADIDRDGDPDLVANLVAASNSPAWYQNDGDGVTWTSRSISTPADQTNGASVGDVDGDGDLDIVSGSYDASGNVRWYENAGAGSTWITHTIGAANAAGLPELADFDGDGDADVVAITASGLGWFRNDSIHQTACFGPVRTIFQTDGPFGAAAADIDRDGDLDVFATSRTNEVVTWHRNDGGGAGWTPFTVATNRSSFFASPADVDGDGDADALLGADPRHAASWAENVGGSAWPLHDIGAVADTSAVEIRGADLDGDGDTDAVGSPGSSEVISWHANLDGAGGLWQKHTVGTTNLGAGAQSVDLDRDGDLDILAAQAPLAWHENVTGNGLAWTTRTISSTAIAIAAIALDVDSDGDLDVIGSNVTGSPGMLWHENLSGNGASWAPHSLSTLPDVFSIAPSDVDGDGDRDLICGRPAGFAWLERTGPGVTFVLRMATATISFAGEVGTPDLDGDGAPDVLWSSQLGDAILWNRNGRGQVVLDLLDQVPTTVNNNDVFPILRVTVTHGGRAGDSDLELARLGLLFEEEPGDPLTSAEANALAEELRIYRDANGNGMFDPGIDALVATVPTLALSAGVQAVPFADGDPNVQVAFGTPRTFFVVAQLTANASQQAPHQFRLTLLALGPSATQAEDRSADIPLTIACPADFASRLIVATPVELMGFTVE